MRFLRAGLVVAFVLGVSACGGAKDAVVAKTASELTPAQIDADPIALLPRSALVVAQVNAHAFFTSSIGAQFTALALQYTPVGDEAGFRPERDVDKVVLGVYALEGADVAAVAQGRFDADKIAAAAHDKTPSKSGAAIVESTYAERTLYTVNEIGFTILTPKTALVGTTAGMHRALDRIHDGKVQRDLAPWMIKTLESDGAELAAAGDFATQPIATASIGALNLPWLKGMKEARVIGDFKDPGMNLAGTLTFGDASGAQSASNGIRGLGTMANLAAMVGLAPRLQNLQVNANNTDVQYTFGLDGSSTRSLVASIPKWMGMARR